MEISQKAKIIMRGIHNYICTLQLNARKNVNVGAHTKVRFANLANHVRIGDYCNIQRGGLIFIPILVIAAVFRKPKLENSAP